MSDERCSVVIGKVLRHYKGGLYRVLFHAVDEETKEKMVVYQTIVGDGPVWVRARLAFDDLVKWPDGVERARFVLQDGFTSDPFLPPAQRAEPAAPKLAPRHPYAETIQIFDHIEAERRRSEYLREHPEPEPRKS